MSRKHKKRKGSVTPILPVAHKTSMSLHHRKCQANGGVTSVKNTVMLPIKIHQAWHTLTQANSPEWIANFITDYLLDPDYEFVCIKRE